MRGRLRIRRWDWAAAGVAGGRLVLQPRAAILGAALSLALRLVGARRLAVLSLLCVVAASAAGFWIDGLPPADR